MPEISEVVIFRERMQVQLDRLHKQHGPELKCMFYSADGGLRHHPPNTRDASFNTIVSANAHPVRPMGGALQTQ